MQARETCRLAAADAALLDEIRALRAENDALRVRLSHALTQLDHADFIISMIKEDEVHNIDAIYEDVGHELRYDYRKYIDAAGQPMTAELGSIVLGQLRTVFDILERKGFNVKPAADTVPEGVSLAV